MDQIIEWIILNFIHVEILTKKKNNNSKIDMIQ